MVTLVKMPQLAESVAEGVITKWLRKEGDRVNENDSLLKVDTGALASEIPCPDEGIVIKILVPEGGIVSAGDALAWIGEAGEGVPDNLNPDSQESRGRQSSSSTENTAAIHVSTHGEDYEKNRGFISPAVAALAKEKGIDLSQVKGTGEGGRITRRDVVNYLSVENRVNGESSPEVWEGGITSTADSEVDTLGDSLMPLRPAEQAIGVQTVLGLGASPYMITVMQADMFGVVTHREAHQTSFAQDGVRLTYTAYFVLASMEALKEFPLLSSTWQEKPLQIHFDINVGLVISHQEEGQVVPVIKAADSLSLLGAARTINDLTERARLSRLKPEEMEGATFSIANHGVNGTLFATSVIQTSQCAILGIGKIHPCPVVINNAIAIRPWVYLTLTYDYRVLDGETAGSFLAKVVKILEEWR